MRLLALDTATEASSVALLSGHSILARRVETARGASQDLLALIEGLLGEAGCTLSMLDGIAASVGPGAFTGVRIGVSVAQGLAYGADLPVVAVSTLEALAQQAVSAGAERVLCCLDARMNEVYWECFAADPAIGIRPQGGPAVGPAGTVSVPFVAPFHGIGRGFQAHPSLAAALGAALAPGAAAALPDARDMATLGALRLAAGLGVEPGRLEPLYLRDKVALTERERGR